MTPDTETEVSFFEDTGTETETFFPYTRYRDRDGILP